MKFLLIYFSGTGNTELITRELAGHLQRRGHSVETVSIENDETLRSMDFNDRIIGFGFPVYKFSYPDIFQQVLPLLKVKSENNRCFLYSTYTRFPGDAVSLFQKELARLGFQVVDRADFKAPSCGIAARKPPEAHEYASVMFFEDRIDARLQEFAERLLIGCSEGPVLKPARIGPFRKLRLRVVEEIERTKYPKLQIQEHLCTSCGLCVARCPEGNLEMIDGSVSIKDDEGCLHCLRCMNRCPANAFSFGRLSEGPNQYRLKDRDAFFAAANAGTGNPYRKDFQSNVRKWRGWTIRYWLKYRGRPEV